MKYQVLIDYLNKHYNMSNDGYDLNYSIHTTTQFKNGHYFDELNKFSEISVSTLLSFGSPRGKSKPSLVTFGNYHFGYNQDILDMISAINKTPRKERLSINQLYSVNIQRDLFNLYNNKYRSLDYKEFEELLDSHGTEDINKLYHDKYDKLSRKHFDQFIDEFFY